jgi:pyridoxine 5-phosphate synthase
VNVKLNMEMAIAEEIVDIAVDLRPDQCTLVPERREELTTEGGLDVVRHRDRIAIAVSRLRDAGIAVNAFIEPIEEQIKSSAEVGFQGIELWTGAFAHAKTPDEISAALADLASGIEIGNGCGLEVLGGHGLTYRNIERIAGMPGFVEFNIGHSIVARSVFVGMREAVSEMKCMLELHAPQE